MPLWRASRYFPRGAGSALGSRESGTAMMSIKMAASLTVLVIGPACARGAKGLAGYIGTWARVGFKPTIPQNEAGIRMLPPASVPTGMVPITEATAADVAPEEAYDMRGVSKRVRVIPARIL